MKHHRIITLSLLALTVGCARTRTYDVTVRNGTHEPLTLGLVKEGGPYERNWAKPEQAAVREAQPSDVYWTAMQPGERRGIGPVSGKFYRSADAVLRVYGGQLNLPGILAVDADAPNRIDIPLKPGKNVVTVIDRHGHFTAVPGDLGPPPAEQRPLHSETLNLD